MRGSSATTPPSARAFRQHLAAGAVVLVAVAAIAVLVSVRVGRDQAQSQALRQRVAGGLVVATRVVAPLVTPAVYEGNADALVALDDRVMVRKAGSQIQRIKVWSEDGVILYSDDPRQIGLQYPLDPDSSRALTSQGVESSVADLSRSENVLDRGFGQSLEVSAGTRDVGGRPILVQTYFTADQLDADEAALIHRIAAVALVSLLALGLLYVPLAYSLARRVSRLSGAAGSVGPGAADDLR